MTVTSDTLVMPHLPEPGEPIALTYPPEMLRFLGLRPETPVMLPRVPIELGLNMTTVKQQDEEPKELVLFDEPKFFCINGVPYYCYGSKLDKRPVLVPQCVAHEWRVRQQYEELFARQSAEAQASAELPSDPSKIPNWMGRH